MKIGCCLNMLGTKEDNIGSSYLSKLKEYGYDYVELPIAQIMELSEKKFNDLLELLKQSDISCESCNNFFPGDIRLTGEDASLEKAEEYVKQAFVRVKQLGAKVVVFGSSGAKNVPEGFDYKNAFKQVVALLKMVNGYAVKNDIMIVIEPLNRSESNIILNLKEGMKLMNEVSGSNVKLLVDYYHLIKEKEEVDILIEVGKDLKHVHFADPEGRKYPINMTQQYINFIQILFEIGYEERISIEAFSDNPEDDLKSFPRVFRSYNPSV